MPDVPLKTVGKYQLTDLLGQGAMGVVYRALDPALNRYVAIKLMGQGMAADPHLRERFMREAQAAGSLQHPNIITIYDFGEVEGHLYIAMEYVEGSDLSQIIERGDQLPLPAKLDIIIDALNALNYAHSRHLVHRDIKPANIRVSVDGHGKLMDFGIARLERSDLTQSGMLVGTPHYMSPEQVTSGQISPATDIFAMGVVLYELLAYRKAFDGDTLHAVLYKVVSEEPPSLAELSPSIPQALRAVVARAIAKDPAARYATAAAMARALTEVREQLSGGAPVTILARRTPLATIATAEERQRERRIAVWGGIAAAVVIVAASVLGFLVTRGARAPAAAPSSAAAQQPASAPGQQPVAPAVASVPASGQPGAGEAGPSTAPGALGAGAAVVTAPPAAQAQRPPRGAPSPGPRADSAVLGAAATGRAVEPAPPPGQHRAAGPEAAQAPAVPPVSPVTQPAPSPPSSAAVTVQNAPTLPPAAPAAAPPSPAAPAALPDPRPEIEQLVASYARAIESRSVSEIRGVYPGLTASQEQGWERFFQTVRSVRANLAITRLQVNGETASLAVQGAYEYNTDAGQQRQPANFTATAVRGTDGWHLQTVR